MTTILIRKNLSNSSEHVKRGFTIFNSDKSESFDHLKESFKQRLAILTDDDLGGWSNIKNKLKKQFSVLTDEDLVLIDGHEDELLIKVLDKLENNTTKLRRLIKSI